LKYVSTRGHSAAQSFTDILLEGLAPDGGLMVPEQWPRIMRAKMDAMRDLPYPRLAFEIGNDVFIANVEDAPRGQRAMPMRH